MKKFLLVVTFLCLGVFSMAQAKDWCVERTDASNWVKAWVFYNCASSQVCTKNAEDLWVFRADATKDELESVQDMLEDAAKLVEKAVKEEKVGTGNNSPENCIGAITRMAERIEVVLIQLSQK